MISSMTGYGEAQRSEEGHQYVLEIRSVNNRYFKASIKLPELFQYLEADIEKLLRTRLARGSLALALRLRNQTAGAAYEVNSRVLACYAKGLLAALPEGANATLDLATLATLPGVCQSPELDESFRAKQASIVRELTSQALDHLIDMRHREGQSLYEDLVEHCAAVRTQLILVEKRAPVVLTEYHERLTSRVQMLIGNGRFDLDKDALAREVALYAERCDIAEEVVRLRAHLDHFMEICRTGEAVGRKLDFLAQEMLREANTIGSKSNDAQIGRAVVELKSIIDRIKEQVQNAE